MSNPSNLSFQQRLKLARKQAFAATAAMDPEKVNKAEARKVAAELAKKEKAEVAIRKENDRRAKEVIAQRKSKRKMDDNDFEPQIDYQPRSRSSTREKPFPNRPLDLENKIKVRVDANTEVYVYPGTDIEAVIAKYKRKPLINGSDDHLPPAYQF